MTRPRPRTPRQVTDLNTAAVVVLAAGSSRRFGAIKQTTLLHGRPLVAHAVRVALEAGVGEVVVVVPGDTTVHGGSTSGGHVADAARLAGEVRIVVNPDPGQAASLRAGIAALGTDTRAAVVMLGDQPLVDPLAVREVASTVLAGAPAARAVYDDAPGHPVGFARRSWPQLLRITGDRGARDLLDDLGVVDCPVAGPAPVDVDTPDDLAAVVRHTPPPTRNLTQVDFSAKSDRPSMRAPT